MDKSWMLLPNRFCQAYVDGVESFIEFTKAHLGEGVDIECPCTNCCNYYKKDYNTVKVHLISRGMMASYTTWLCHGELPQSNEQDDSEHEFDDDVYDVYGQLLEDHYNRTRLGSDTEHIDVVRDFEKLLVAARRRLYPNSSKQETLLAFVIDMLQLKVNNGWSNHSFNDCLSKIRQYFPEGHEIPRSINECKKLLRDLGLGYDLIHACPNDFVLFWKENSHLENCPKCKSSRYKINDGKRKKIPQKILRYFPLIPRLQRLYMNSDIAEDMRWHYDKRVDDGRMRHPADNPQWKELDLKNPNFAKETRNVRLGIATDGFNPFGNMSVSYSMWPVILIPYNLPPWKCMKDSFFMMTLLIPGPNQPGTNLDVYLRPLVEELDDLWRNGVMTYDASAKKTFQMHASFIWTIHDFPAYGDVSGWRTKGYLSCPTCNDNPLSQRLIDKIGWVGHRAYLPENHPWRKNKTFNGKPEFDKKSLELSVEKVISQLKRLRPIEFGRDNKSRKRARHHNQLNWTKKSFLWDLPYVQDLLIRHNLDVMHIEKNICENLYGTILCIEGKNKDTHKARNDLEKMGIRHELHLQTDENGKIVKPRASYTLEPQQEGAFYEFLKSISYPDGYAANISRCVTSKNGRLYGMKSHDCHVLLQRILPIGLRGLMNKEICTTLFELGNFFQELCSKTILQSDMEKWEERVVLILCKLEKIFPPAFFDVMVHLAVHLSREAMIGGPVQYRWMYPIERFLGVLKKYVSNKARPEGSIAEAYILQECITFCSLYLNNEGEKPERNIDGVDSGFKMAIFNQHVRLFSCIKGAPQPSSKEMEIAHWCVLQNCPEVEPYLKKYLKNISHSQGRDITKIQQEEFPKWFKKHMNVLRTKKSKKASNELWSLANGPSSLVDMYSGCIYNGVRYHTRDREIRRTCQNSGILVNGDDDKGNYSNYYGYLAKIWELRYANGGRVTLFQCEWYNTGHKSRTYTDEHVTSIDITRFWYKDEPFVLPSNVRQVFYVNDTIKGKNWRVVELVRHRGVWDVPEKDEFSRDPFQQDETEDGGIPINIEDFEIQHQMDNVNYDIQLLSTQVDDHNNDDDDDYDDDADVDIDVDDADLDVNVDADVDDADV